MTQRLALFLVLAGCVEAPVTSSRLEAKACDGKPVGIERTDFRLSFTVPAGLMPDPRFDGRTAEIEVRRVRPTYAPGKCPALRKAAVLIHGRTVPGPPTFDLLHVEEAGEEPRGRLSIQEALARAGIDTFAPSLLGYGRSSRFSDGLDDPCNASLPDCSTGAVPCDRTHNPIFARNQQATLLGIQCAHSYGGRFAGTDVWVRDIGQVIEDARERAGVDQVTLVGYSFGAQRVGRALDEAKYPDIVASVDRVVFLAPLFLNAGGSQVQLEELPAPPGGYVTFPLALTPASAGGWAMPPGRDEVCTGHVIPGVPEEQAAEVRELDPLGASWAPGGLNRSPTFSGYGFNSTVAGQIAKPTLVMQGLDDIGLPPLPPGMIHGCELFRSLPPGANVLVLVDCASHAFLSEGCSGERCKSRQTPYGGRGGKPWGGPHETLQAALVEWITDGTFAARAGGRFLVDAAGVAHEGTPACM
jgi:pimeloyl-ACP methyl ester carboxylesterase